jgi:hypothetical protein
MLMISQKALPPQAGLGAQELRSEAQRRSWTFYETINVR